MRAVVCTELGPLDRLVVEDRALPVAAPWQVVVEVRAAGVNFVDGLICEGKYQIKPATPFVPGGEVAGVVAQLGDGVTGLSVGDPSSSSPGSAASPSSWPSRRCR